MDAGLTGGLIGIGVMVCVVITSVCHEKIKKQVHIPLLPVSIANPVLVRSGSKQWKMKELALQ
jgi:hypothetical protein